LTKRLGDGSVKRKKEQGKSHGQRVKRNKGVKKEKELLFFAWALFLVVDGAL
jgi:hypothetical protein